MDGALLQLIAKNTQDLPLTGKPEITPFKKVYRKYNPFAIMDHEVILPDLKFGSSFTSKFSQAGDLTSKVYLKLQIPEFLLNKKIINKEQVLSYSDNLFLIKKQILERLSQIEDKVEYVLDDNTIRKFSPKSMGRFLNILLKEELNSDTTEYYLNYLNNYQTISYLLNSNLTNETMILGKFFLDYLDIIIKNVEELDSGNNILIKKYQKFLDDYIKNYFLNSTFGNKKEYQIYDETNQLDIFNQTITYYLGNPISSDLAYIQTNILGRNQELINLTKNIMDFDFNYYARFIHQLFPQDNFYSSFNYLKTLYPFFILQAYDSNLENKLDTTVTDARFTLENYWVNNFLNLGEQTGFVSPISDITEKTLTNYRSVISKEFESLGYQNILGNKPLEIWTIIASIQELWKWQIYYYEDEQTNFVPSYEFGSLPEKIRNFPAFLLGSWTATDNMLKNLRIDFSQRTTGVTDPKNIDEIISDLKEIYPTITKFNDSYSHLNRAGYDLNLLYLYSFYVYGNELKISNLFKTTSSYQWINWMHQVITNKLFSRWVSQYQVRISTDYLRVESIINTDAVSTVNLEEKIPFISIGDNEYLLDTDIIKDLIRHQAHKYNYLLKISDSNHDLSANNNYILDTTKKYNNISVTILNGELTWEYNDKYFYHHPNNIYYFSKNTELIKIKFNYKSNNIINFTTNLPDGNYTGDIVAVIKTNIPVISDKSFDESIIKIITDSNSITLKNNEIDRYNFSLLIRDKNDIIIDFLPIPSQWVDISNNIFSNTSFNLPNDITTKYQDFKFEYHIIDYHDLPNLFSQTSKSDYLDCYNLEKGYQEFSFTDFSSANYNTYDDDLRQLSYLHQIPFGILSNNLILIYHLPFKINNQILDNINISTSNFMTTYNLLPQARIKNLMNYYEIIGGKVRAYSEGVDFLDININNNYFDNLSINEEEYLETIIDFLFEKYNDIIEPYKNIFYIIDKIQQEGFISFINTLSRFSEIGYTYQQVINNFTEENSNNISIKQLPYWKGQSFNNYYYWKNKIEFSNNGLYQSNNYFEDLSDINLNSEIDNLTNSYQLNKIFDDSNLEFINNVGNQFKNQIEKIESNRDLLINFPKTTNNETFNTSKNKTEYQIEKVLTDSEENKYIIETSEVLSDYDYIRIDNKIVNIISDLGNNKYEISSEETLPVSLPQDGIEIDKIDKDYFNGTFYGYGIANNGKVILSPIDYSKNYSLYNSNLEELNLEYTEINENYIQITNQDLSSVITNFTDIIVLKDENNNFYPYGKIIPSFEGLPIYYRKKENDNQGNIYLVGKYLIENPSINNRILISDLITNTDNYLVPIIQLKEFNYETFNITYFYNSSGNYLIFGNDFKVKELDYLFIQNKWCQITSIIGLFIYLADNLTGGNYTETVKIFRYLGNSIPTINQFKSITNSNVLDYNFKDLTWMNHLFVYQKLEPLHIRSQNGNIIELEEELKIGDIIYNDGTIHQITQKQDKEYQFSPIKIFENLYLIKDYFNQEKIYDNNLLQNNLSVNIVNNTEFVLRNKEEYEEQKGAADPRFTHFANAEINGFDFNNIPREKILHDYTNIIIQTYKELDFSINFTDAANFFNNDAGPRVFNWKGWIDWKNNGLFEDNSDNIIFEFNTGLINPKSPLYISQSFNISIPDNAKIGVTRMRVMLVTSNSTPVTLTPDYDINQGIVVDFAIKISNLNTLDNLNSIFNNQIINLPLRQIPTTNYLINTFDQNEWIYRQLKPGDMYFNTNKLELNLDNSTNSAWVIQPQYNFCDFIPTSTLGWFEIYTNESFKLNLGSIILDTSEITITESYDLAEIYSGTPIAIIDGKLGNLVHLNSINSYGLNNLSGVKLIHQYPWKYKSPYNSEIKEEYKYLLNWDNTSSNLFDGDYSDNHILYLEYPEFKLTFDNNIVFNGLIDGDSSGTITNQIYGNKLTITSGINLSTYETINFTEDMIIPLQEIYVDDIRTRVIELSGNNLILDKKLSDFSKNITNIRLPNKIIKENFVNKIKTNPVINLFDITGTEANISIIKKNNQATQIINHYLEKGRIESISNTLITLSITQNLIDFVKNNSTDYSSGEAIDDNLYININNLYIDNNYQIDETNYLLKISFFKNKDLLENNEIVLLEEITKDNQNFIHYGKLGYNNKDELGYAFLNNQTPFSRDSQFYLKRHFKVDLNPDTFNIQKINNTYYLNSNLIWPEDTNNFITLRDNEIFDGQGFTISVGNSNGDGEHFGIFKVIGTDFSSAPIIKNLTVKSKVKTRGGGFVRGYDLVTYPRYFIVENCKFKGYLFPSSGGIVGTYAGFQGQFRISNCYAEYEMNQGVDGAGGIAGDFCARNGIGLIEKCIGSGDIYGGGIVALYNAYDGYLRITNCYTTGDIKTWTVPNWTTERSGGITGRYTGGNNGEIYIDNCYTLGTIGSNSGGITGTRTGIIEGGFSSSKVIITNCYCNGRVIADIDNTTTVSNSEIYVDLSQVYHNFNETISMNLTDITYQIDTTSQIDASDYSGIGISVPDDINNWDTTNIWLTGNLSTGNEYPKLKVFQNNPFNLNYETYQDEPEFLLEIVNYETIFNYINLEKIEYQNVSKFQDNNLVSLKGYKKIEFNIDDTLKVNNNYYYLDVKIKNDYSDSLPNLETVKLFYNPNENLNYLTYYQTYLDKSGVLVDSVPFSQAKYQYYLENMISLDKVYPKFKKVNNEIINYTDDEINKLLITQNNSLEQELKNDYLLIPYYFTIQNISEFYKGNVENLDLSSTPNLNQDYRLSVNNSSLKINYIQLVNNQTIIEVTSNTDLVNNSPSLQNIDIFYQVPRNYDYYNETINLHQDLLHHQYEFKSFNEKNYLVQQVLLLIEWDKIYKLNQSYYQNSPYDNSIIDISGSTIFDEDYLEINDYQELISLDLSNINTDKQEYIDLIIDQIYCRIPNWILLEEFRNEPDDFLKEWLQDYDLSWDSSTNTFLDLSNNNYLEVKLPTNYQVNGSNKIEFKISPEIGLDELFSRLDNINQDFSKNTISDNDIIYLTKTINFYDLWDVIKKYKIDLLPYLSSKTNLYEIIGNKFTINHQELNSYSTYEVIKDNSPVYVNKEFIEGSFNYYKELINLPEDVSINQVNFLKEQVIFEDPFINETYDHKKLSFNIDNFIPKQDGIINGFINYQVINQLNQGQKVQVTTVLSLESDLSDSNALFRYKFYNDNDLLDYQIIDHNTFIINNEIMENLTNIRFELDLPVSIRNNKFYLPENVTKFTQSDTIYLKSNNNYLELELSGNEIKNLTHQTYQPKVTLAKFSLINDFSNNYQFQYQLLLDKPLNLNPYEFYQTTTKDFTIYDSSNNVISNFELDLQDSNLITIYLNQESTISKLVQEFSIGTTPEYLVTSYNLDSSGINITTLKEIDTSGFNHNYFHYFDLSGSELGNYLIRITGNDLSSNMLNQEIFSSDGNYFGKFVNVNDTSQGWIVTNKLFNLDMSYNILIPSRQYFQEIYLTSDHISTYFEFTFNDSNNKINSDLIKTNFTLPSELPDISQNTILQANVILRETDNLIYNSKIEEWKKELNDLKEDYYQTQTNITFSEETINWQEELGYNIIESASLTIENQIIEEFDKDWMSLYKYYFVKSRQYRGLEKINNGLNLYIPLPFWFTQGYHNSFPIFLCQDSKINLHIKLSKLNKLINNTGSFTNHELIKTSLCYETIWLSEEEKLFISSRNQEHLIQVTNLSQLENIAKLNYQFYLKFRGAIKDFFFIFKMPSNKWNQTHLEIDDYSKIDDFYKDYLNNKNTSSSLYQEMLNNKKTLLEDFSNVISEFSIYEENFVCYLIHHHVGSLKYDSGIPNENYVEACLRLYFTYSYHGVTKKPLYPMGEADIMINDRQLFTNKDSLFWSLLHQTKYQNNGDLDKYGYSHAIYPLESQPSGHINYDKVKAMMRLTLNEQFYQELITQFGYCIMKIFYRNYKLLKFMGNQVGVLF